MLLDDEMPGLTYLKMLCEQLPDVEIVKTFNNPEVMLQEIGNLQFDLCILDIQMPGMNGLQIARVLGDKPVIFTTAYKEFAADAYDLNAIDYVRKPVSLDRLRQAIAKVQSRLNSGSTFRAYMHVNTDKGKAIIHFDQLRYVRTSEVDSRDKIAQLQNGNLLTLKNISFEKLLSILPENDFAQINKRELIAMKAVQLFSSEEITTNIQTASGQLRLVLGDVYRADFIKKIRV